MENLLLTCQPYIDEKVYQLLEDLIVHSVRRSYEELSKVICEKEPFRIYESALRLDMAVNEDGDLQKRINLFREHREKGFKELHGTYKLREAILDPVTAEFRELKQASDGKFNGHDINGLK